ncbi:hypothetical protein [Paenibacillus sp. LHD-38]|uniref:hypothetical protein n=1 Tax=Paenibacillus sp. LHD-38 TaxID=3072143 RepID=UPI00280F7FAF|nr:hypothetical protein [Paenibacillus sp. LHD-38]MDQ8734941.1 hypothetical protein [Paenibacillus sp. LHD-38]
MYHDAKEAAERGVHVLSTDEKTGIQAKEHAHASLLMKPGKVIGIDPEYIRHGTSGLIVSRDVVTGKVVAPLTIAHSVWNLFMKKSLQYSL